MTHAPSLYVREATPADTDVVAAHHTMAVDESTRYRGSRVATPPYPTTITLVAGVGDSVFGSLVAGTDDGSSWTISHVFVEPEAREIGLGDALVVRLLQELRARGAGFLASQAQPGDRALKNLFERHGLVARTIIVGRTID